MRYAKSIYRGGEIIDASLCDYESSKKLGLICPFCSQAVFLRAGSYYERHGKKIVSPWSFCHYHSDDPLALECELRAKRKDGKEYIERLRIESRNQRLKLFNTRMTDILNQCWTDNYQYIKQLYKLYGKKWIEVKTIELRHELNSNFSFYLTELEMIHKQVCKPKLYDNPNDLGLKIWTKQEIQEQNQKLSFIDKQIHFTICTEVLEFLSTRTGGYAFLKFLSLAIISLSLTRLNFLLKRQVGLESLATMKGFIQSVENTSFLNATLIVIVFTNWLIIYDQLSDSQELNGQSI